MKKRLLLLATLVFALTLCVSFAVAGVAFADNSVEWTVRDSSKDGYTVNDDGTITAGADNNGWNFLLCDSYTATGDYSVTADIKGTIASSSDGNAQLGIVPWYLDGDNYVVVYAEWWTTRTREDVDYVEMKCVQVTGLVNGQDLGWDDRWTDYVTTSPADGVKLVVIKAGETFSFSLQSADGQTVLKSGDKTVSGLSTENAQIGIYGNGDNGATFEVSTTLSSHQHDYQKVEAKEATTSALGNIEYYTCSGCDELFVKNDEGQYVVTTRDAVFIPQIVENIEWTERNSDVNGYTVNEDGTITAGANCGDGWNFLLCDNYIAKGDYTVTAVINSSVASQDDGDTQIGIVPWYIDGNNYVVIYAEWWETRDGQAQMRLVQITGMNNGVDLDWNNNWTDGITYAPNSGIKLVVTKTNNTFAFKCYQADGSTLLKEGSLTVSGLSDANAKFGIYSKDSKGATFSVKTDLPVHTHDYETSTVYASDGENHYKVCAVCGAENTANKVACSGGEATCVDKAICEVCQNAYGSVNANNHKNVGSEYSKDETGHWYVCADCGGKVDFEGHTSSGAATEETAETCTVCGYEISPVLPHSHNYIEVAEEDSTCQKQGHDTYYTCDGCELIFVLDGENNYVETTLESVTRAFADHDFENSTEYASDGENHCKVCAVCGAEDTANKVACSGGEATCVNKAICDVCQNAYGSVDANNHKNIESEYTKDATGHWHACADCESKIDFEEHTSSGAATETVPETCTVCGYEISPVLSHVHNYIEVAEEESTCQKQGHDTYYTCDGCNKLFVLEGETYAETTLADVTRAFANHDFENSTRYASDGENHYKVCAVCGAEDTANKVACSGGEATCVNKAICDVCQNAYGSVNANNHKNVGSEYSKDETGHWYVCADCGGKVDFEGHTSSGAATEETAETCTVCGYEISPVLPHSHNYIEVAEEDSTCQKQGHDTYYTCDGCELIFVLESENNYVETTLESVTRALADHDFENSTRYASDGDNHWKICANCDEEDAEHKEAHAGGSAGLNSYAECATCGHEYGTTTSDWQVTDSNNAGYTDLENNSVKYDGSSNQDITNNNNKGAFFINTKSDATGNFTLSASITGTNTQEADGYVKAGLIPWYLDEDNYVIVWVQWWEERGGEKQMRNAEITAYIDGTFQGWEDIWCDGITVAPADGIKLVIAKSGSTFAVELQKADGTSLKSGAKSFALPDGDARIGVYALGDELTYSVEITAEGSGATPVVKELWEKDGENYISNNNTAQYDKFYLLDDVTVLGNSTITVDLKGTMTLPNSKTVNAGVVPWYIDENNYVYVYVEWNSGERPSDIRNIEVTGKIDGKSFYRWLDGAYVEKQWNDIWCDGVHISAETGLTLKVETKLSQNGDAVEITAAIINSEGNVVISDTFTIRDIVKYASVPAKVGLYAYNDTFTFSNLTVVNNTDDNRNFKNEGSFVANGADWSEQDGVYSVDASGISSLTNNMAILSNKLTDKSYSISMNVALSNLSDANGVGMLVWYVDRYNYLYAYVDGEYIGFKGVYTTSLGAKLEETQTIIDQKVAYTGGDVTSLNVVKRAGRFTFTAGGQSVDVSVDEMLDSANYGMLVYGASAQFSDIEIVKVDFSAFDTVSDNLGGKDYQISAKEENSITYDNGTFTITADAIDQTGEKLTSVIWNTSYFDIAGISAKFTVLDGGVYGFYPWYINSTNYVLVKVSTNGIEVSAQFGEWSETKSVNLPDAFLYAGEHTLEAKLNLGKLSLELDGQALDIDFTAQGIDYTLSPKVGFVASVEALTVADVEVEGFKQRDTITEGDWEFRGGAHADTWTLNEDGSISGKFNGGTQWQGTLALKSIDSEVKDYYTSATIVVNDVDASEYKTGIIPWYVDGNNYVFVWLSKWSDGSPCIVVTAKINGKVIGEEWRETQVAYNYVGETHFVEVKIEGDEIAVYLNKSFNPTYTTTIEGLSARNMENSYAGFNISNTSALFGNITLQSDARKFVLTEKPVITPVTTPATTGTVGTRIKLAIASATSSSGETLSATVKVLDPNGNEVEVKTGAFTPEVEGVYTVTYTCTDLWGNVADEYSYTVTVGEASNQGGNESSQGDNDSVDNPSEGSNALAIGLGVGIPVAVIAIVAVVLIILKRKGIIGKREK